MKEESLLKTNYMNKNVMALAVAGALAAPTAVLAQNAVTIGGKITMGIESVSAGGQSFVPSAGLVHPISGQTNTNAGGLAGDTARFGAQQSQMQSRLRSYSQSSQLIFQATEDLGGGNKFTASVPIYFAPDCQAAGATPLAGTCGLAGFGDTYVQVEGGWGKLKFGKYAIHYTAQLALIDTFYTDSNVVMANSGFYAAGLGGNGLTSGYGLAISGRTDSFLQYTLPKIANALTIEIGTNVNSHSNNIGKGTAELTGQQPIQNAGAVLGTNSASSSKNPRNWSTRFSYSSGPISAMYSYYNSTNQAFNGNALQFSSAANSHDSDALRSAPNQGAVGVGSGTAFGGQLWSIGNGVTANFGAIATSGNATIKSHRAGFKFDFGGGFKAGVVWDKTSNDVNFNTTLGSFSTSTGAATAVTGAAVGTDNYTISRTAWHIPLFYNVGKSEFYAAYGKGGQMKFGGSLWNNAVAAGASGSQTGGSQFSLGYKYNVSSRTKMVFGFTRISNEDRAAVDLRTNVIGLTPYNRGADISSLNGGIVHSF